MTLHHDVELNKETLGEKRMDEYRRISDILWDMLEDISKHDDSNISIGDTRVIDKLIEACRVVEERSGITDGVDFINFLILAKNAGTMRDPYEEAEAR